MNLERSDKEAERYNLLLGTARWYCDDLNSEAGGPTNPTREYYHVDDRALRYVIVRYFDDVDAFKVANDFGDHLINESKQAALMVRAIMAERPIVASRNVPDTVHLAASNVWFAYVVAADLMGVVVSRVSDTVTEELIHFIMTRFGADPSSDEDARTLMLLFQLLRATMPRHRGFQWFRHSLSRFARKKRKPKR